MIATTSVTPPPKRTPASGQVSVAHCSHPSDVSIDLPVFECGYGESGTASTPRNSQSGSHPSAALCTSSLSAGIVACSNCFHVSLMTGKIKLMRSCRALRVHTLTCSIHLVYASSSPMSLPSDCRFAPIRAQKNSWSRCLSLPMTYFIGGRSAKGPKRPIVLLIDFAHASGDDRTDRTIWADAKENCDENKLQSRGDTSLGASEPLRRGSGQPALPPSSTLGSLLSQ